MAEAPKITLPSDVRLARLLRETGTTEKTVQARIAAYKTFRAEPHNLDHETALRFARQILNVR